MRSAKSMKSFSFSAVASPTYDDHLDASFDDYSNYVDEVTLRLSTARDLTFFGFVPYINNTVFNLLCSFQEEGIANDVSYIDDDFDKNDDATIGNEVGLDLKLTSEEIIAEIQGLKPLLPIVATIANPILPPTESGMCGVTKLCVFRHINLR